MGLSLSNIKPNLKAIKDTVVSRLKTKKNIQGIGTAAYKEHWNKVREMSSMDRGYNKNANIASSKAKEAIKDMKKQIPKKFR